jgi:hypothetical protein
MGGLFLDIAPEILNRIEGGRVGGQLIDGQSVGLVKRVQPLREILQQLVEEADAAVAAAEQRIQGLRVPNALVARLGLG